jgi:hypothetical protein
MDIKGRTSISSELINKTINQIIKDIVHDTDVQSLEQSGYKTTINPGTNKYIFIHLSKTEKV